MPEATITDIRRAREEAQKYTADGVSDEALMARRKELLKERDLASARLVLDLQKLDQAGLETDRINKELRTRGEVYKKGKGAAQSGLVATPRASSPVKSRRTRTDVDEVSGSEASEAIDSADEGSTKGTMAGVTVY